MIAILLAAAALQAAAPAPDPCPVDERAMLALPLDAFDQDMAGGWRALSQRPGCAARAADLIRAYREAAQRRMAILYWHEAQLRAEAGETDAAVRLMGQARHPTEEDGWNAYVDASIAFLRGDRDRLVAARDRLAALPMPEGFREARFPAGFAMRWPLNLDVIEGFIRCFGRPYREAYGSPECRRPPERR